MNFKEKYLKYKMKYNNIKNNYLTEGGGKKIKI